MLVKKENLLPGRNGAGQFIHWTFISWISQKGIHKTPEWESLPEKSEIDVTITIEGVEISYETFINRIQQAFDDKEMDMKRRAKKMAVEMIHSAIEKVETEDFESLES